MTWLLLGGLALAQVRPPTLEDAKDLRSAGQLALSPDARTLVYEEWRWGEETRQSDLWLVSLQPGATPRRLTFTEASEEHPTFSPDSRSLYFDRAMPEGAGRQVLRLDLERGTEQVLTEVEGGVVRWALGPKGRQLYLVVEAEQPRDDDFASLRTVHAGPTYVDATATTHRLLRLDLQSFRTEELVGAERAILELAPSPDGRHVALITAPDTPLLFREGWSEVEILELATRSVFPLEDTLFRAEAPSPYGWLGGLAWSHDGASLAFTVAFDGHPTELLLATFDAKGDASVSRVPREGLWSVTGGLQWRDPHTLCFGVSEEARRRVRCRDFDQDEQPAADLSPGERVVRDYVFSADGTTLITEEARLDSVGELYLSRKRPGWDRPRQLTELNPQVAELQLPQISLVSWAAPDGTMVQGVLELPADWEPEDGPLPTVVHLHGGPTWATHAHLELGVYRGRGHLPTDGYALFSPNYRGSTGYGDPFMVELVGRENDVEVDDILAGVDHLVAQGIADPERLGVMGWSNGGYLTNCLISRTDRFKAASSGAGVFDQALQWAIEDTPGHVVNYMEGLPWERPEAHLAASPLFHAGTITTPTLIHVGEHDPRVPAAHARALHRALSVYLDVPTELIIYPDEGHGLSRWSHRFAKAAWDKAWFKRYLLGVGEKVEPEGAEAPPAP